MLMAIPGKGDGKPKAAAKETKRTSRQRKAGYWLVGPARKEEVMTKGRRRPSNIVKDTPEGAAPETQAMTDAVEKTIAPAAIERALTVYQQLQPRDRSVIVQAKKILTQHIYGMVDRGERDEQRLTVGGLAHLKAIERDHAIKSAQGVEASSPA
jgi:hypothetical protein